MADCQISNCAAPIAMTDAARSANATAENEPVETGTPSPSGTRRLSLIVAVSKNGVIGRDGELPWRLSSDLKRFKRLTMGHTLIMGRKTFDSIGRCLPGRTTIVLTRQKDWSHPGALVAHDWSSALELARGDNAPFVVGGAEVYRMAIADVDRVYLTRVDALCTGDAEFPEFRRADWNLIEKSDHAADDCDEFAHTFEVLDRVKKGK